jgi:plasmid maintenance system killer protein
LDVRFTEKKLDELETELAVAGGLSAVALTAYRGRLQALRAAPREQALLGLRSFEMRRFPNGTHALRVTDDWDLLVAFEDGSEGRVAVVEALVQRTTTNSERPS